MKKNNLLVERFQALAGIQSLKETDTDLGTGMHIDDEEWEREMGRGDEKPKVQTEGREYDEQALVNTLGAETTQTFMNIAEEVADATGADRGEVYDFVQEQLWPAYHEAAALLIRAYEETSARSIENFKS